MPSDSLMQTEQHDPVDREASPNQSKNLSFPPCLLSYRVTQEGTMEALERREWSTLEKGKRGVKMQGLDLAWAFFFCGSASLPSMVGGGRCERASLLPSSAGASVRVCL